MARIAQTTNEVVKAKKEAEARIICFCVNRTDNNRMLLVECDNKGIVHVVGSEEPPRLASQSLAANRSAEQLQRIRNYSRLMRSHFGRKDDWSKKHHKLNRPFVCFCLAMFVTLPLIRPHGPSPTAVTSQETQTYEGEHDRGTTLKLYRAHVEQKSCFVRNKPVSINHVLFYSSNYLQDIIQY
jgi:hypothetical protein